MPALASAEAERVTKVGLATAEAIEKQAAASGGARYQLTRQIAERFAEALEKSGVDIVPRIQVSDGAANGAVGGGLMQSLMAILLSERASGLVGPAAAEATKEGSGAVPG